MKKQILQAVMMGLLFVSCTTKNDPSQVEQRSNLNSHARSYYVEYEDLYEYLQIYTIPDILEFQDFVHLQYEIAHGYISGEDIDYGHIMEILEDNQGNIDILVEDALRHCGLPLYLLDNNLTLNSHLIDSVAIDMLDSVYVTQSYRERVFYDGYISEQDKFALCVMFAVNNKIYEYVYGNTIVIKDMQNKYTTIQLPNTNNQLISWLLPCGVREVSVSDLVLFDTAHIYSYLPQSLYISLDTHQDRMNYFYNLENWYSVYYVTRQECEEQKEAATEELLDDIAMTVVFSFFGGVDAVGLAALGGAVYFTLKYASIEIEYNHCLEEAEDDNND